MFNFNRRLCRIGLENYPLTRIIGLIKDTKDSAPMPLIKPLQNVMCQLDAAYRALEASPHSLERQRHYDGLKQKQDSLLAEAKARLNTVSDGF